jgi:hypothetical protein
LHGGQSIRACADVPIGVWQALARCSLRNVEQVAMLKALNTCCVRQMPDPTHRCRARRRSIVAGALACLGAAVGAAARGDSVAAEVWIDLSEPVPAGAPDAAEARQRRLRVSAQQERVAQRLRELGVTELGRVVHTRNAILARIAPQQTQAVLDIPGVRRLRPSRTLHPPKPLP